MGWGSQHIKSSGQTIYDVIDDITKVRDQKSHHLHKDAYILIILNMKVKMSCFDIIASSIAKWIWHQITMKCCIQIFPRKHWPRFVQLELQGDLWRNVPVIIHFYYIFPYKYFPNKISSSFLTSGYQSKVQSRVVLVKDVLHDWSYGAFIQITECLMNLNSFP